MGCWIPYVDTAIDSEQHDMFTSFYLAGLIDNNMSDESHEGPRYYVKTRVMVKWAPHHYDLNLTNARSCQGIRLHLSAQKGSIAATECKIHNVQWVFRELTFLTFGKGWKTKIIFKSVLGRDRWVPRRVSIQGDLLFHWINVQVPCKILNLLKKKIRVALEGETNQSFMIDRNLTKRGFRIVWRWISQSSLESFCCKPSWIFRRLFLVWDLNGIQCMSSSDLDLDLHKKKLLKINYLREHPTSNFVLLSLQKFSCKANRENMAIPSRRLHTYFCQLLRYVVLRWSESP